jgi:hypothetical protein
MKRDESHFVLAYYTAGPKLFTVAFSNDLMDYTYNNVSLDLILEFGFGSHCNIIRNNYPDANTTQFLKAWNTKTIRAAFGAYASRQKLGSVGLTAIYFTD